MNKIRLGAFAILFASIIFLDSVHPPGDKLPSGWWFYAIPVVFLLIGLSIIVLAVDAVIVSAKWTMRRFGKKRK